MFRRQSKNPPLAGRLGEGIIGRTLEPVLAGKEI